VFSLTFRPFGQIPNRYLSGVALEIGIRRQSRSFIGTIFQHVWIKHADVFALLPSAIRLLSDVAESLSCHRRTLEHLQQNLN
jgi:hypothetical protein